MSRLVRQFHRCVCIIFTLGVIANTVVIFMLSKGRPPPTWIYPFALIPLFLLLFSGLYLFALPYMTKRARA